MNVSLSMPHSWKELSVEQLLFVSKQMLILRDKTRQEFLIKSFIHLVGLQVYHTKKGEGENSAYLFRDKRSKKTFVLYIDQIVSLSKECNFLLEKISPFTPLPKIKGKKPRDFYMYESVFDEFLSALIYFQKFQETQEFTWIDKLTSIFYPCKKWNLDKVDKRAKKFKYVPMYKKYTCFLWFGAILNYLSKVYPYIFGSGSSGEVELEEMVNGMLDILNDGDITKDETILNMNTYRVLSAINKKCEQQKMSQDD